MKLRNGLSLSSLVGLFGMMLASQTLHSSWLVAASTTTTTTSTTNTSTNTKINKDLCTMNQQCLNGGKCVDGNDTVPYKHCDCLEGYSGPHCSRHCPLQCDNGGYCTVNPRGGARGDQDQKPSQHPSDFICKCHGYFMGTLCEIPYTNCGNQVQCLNGGTCATKSSSTTIDIGTSHDHSSSSSSSSSSTSSSPACHCPPEYTGDSCETLVPEDELQKNIETTMAMAEDSRGRRTGGTIAILLIVIIVGGAFSVYLIGRRKGWTWRTIASSNYNDDEETFMIQAGVRRMNFHEPTSVRHWSSTYNSNRGVELNLI